jgi:hypothetical protein
MSRSFFLREDIFHPPDSSSSTAPTTATEAARLSPTTAVATEKVSIPTAQEFITTTAASSADPDRLTSTTTTTSTTIDAPTKMPPSSTSSPSQTKLAPGDRSVAGIADAISGLDKDIVSSVILEVATAKEKLTDPEIRKLKLQVLSQQNELIKQEKADQEQANLAKKKEKGQQVAAAAAAAAVATAGAEYTVEQKKQQQQSSLSSSTESGILNAAESKDAPPPPTSIIIKPFTPEIVEKSKSEEEDQSMDLSTNEMDALRQLVSEDPVSSERAQFQQIKAAMSKKHDVDEEDGDEEPIMAMDVNAPEATVPTMGESEPVSTSVEALTPKPAMTPEETDRMVAETIEWLDTMAATSDSTTVTKTTTTATDSETESRLPSKETTDVVEEDDAYHLEEEMVVDDPIVARLKKRVESMLDKIEVQLSDVHSKIGDKLHMLDKDKDGILTQQEVAGVLQQVLKRELTPEEANEIAGEMVSKCGRARRFS